VEYREQYRGFRIIACELKGGYQAKIKRIGALSDFRSNAQDAIRDIKSYLDEQAAYISRAAAELGWQSAPPQMTLIVALVRPRRAYFWRPCCLQSRLSAPATPCV